MPRPLRPIDDGLVYHVINRGNNRANVFHTHDDDQAFRTAIADLKCRRPFDLFGYCLMPNHFHLLIRPRGRPRKKATAEIEPPRKSPKTGRGRPAK